jgi:hypothetical protein
MDRYTASQAYLAAVSTGCLATTAIAFSRDDDSGWMLATAAVSVPVILIAARERRIADQLRRWPAGGRLCGLLLAVAVCSGLLDLNPEELVGLLGTTVLVYLVVVLLRTRKAIRRQ